MRNFFRRLLCLLGLHRYVGVGRVSDGTRTVDLTICRHCGEPGVRDAPPRP